VVGDGDAEFGVGRGFDVVLLELGLAEQRYGALLEVINDAAPVTVVPNLAPG
jgi:hypothetical protein